MHVKALVASALALSATVAMAQTTAKTIPAGKNTWSKNKCGSQPPSTRVIPTSGLSSKGGPTNCQPGTFGMYYNKGRKVLTNGYPILYTFASNQSQTIATSSGPVTVDWDSSRLFMHKLLVQYLKYYIYVQCRCTSNMVPSMKTLQLAFTYEGGNTTKPVDSGLIAAFEAFVLAPNNWATIVPVQLYLQQFIGAYNPSNLKVLDDLRCAATSKGGALTPGACTLSIKANAGSSTKVGSVSSTVTCPKGTCPQYTLVN